MYVLCFNCCICRNPRTCSTSCDALRLLNFRVAGYPAFGAATLLHRDQVTHRPLSSSFLGLPYRILNLNHKKELLGASLYFWKPGLQLSGGMVWVCQKPRTCRFRRRIQAHLGSEGLKGLGIIASGLGFRVLGFWAWGHL